MNIFNYIVNQIAPKKDISSIVEIIELTEEEAVALLKLISITEKEIYDKKTEIRNSQRRTNTLRLNNEEMKKIKFGNDALLSYQRISHNILSMFTGLKKDFRTNVYELDYLLSTIEIGKDLISETGKEIVPIDVLDSLFMKIYEKHRKYKREIMDFFVFNDENERIKILENMYKKRD